MAQIAQSLQHLAKRNDVAIIYPLHPNPNVGEVMRPALSGCDNIALIDPLDYLDFVAMMAACDLVLTDSGGIQEESTYLGVPCFTLRDNTERPITVSEGTNTLLGLDPARIEQLPGLLSHAADERKPAPAGWDGRAAERAAERVVAFVEG